MGIFDGWLLGTETAIVANRLGGVATLTGGIRDFGPGGKGSGGSGPSLITPDIFTIPTVWFGAHCVPPVRHLSAPSQPAHRREAASFTIGTGQQAYKSKCGGGGGAR